MIFALFGTNPYPFIRLRDMLLDIADDYEIIAQTGSTPIDCVPYECHDYLSHDEVMGYIAHADILVTQAGFGSLKDCISSGKPVVAVPRKPELGESQDEQSEIAEELERLGSCVVLHDNESLRSAIGRACSMQHKALPKGNIPDIVRDVVEKEFSK